MFIQRDESGEIIAISESKSQDFLERADDNDPAFLKFLKCQACKATIAQNTLEQTDTELVRVLEDVIELMNQKGIIQFTDLPKAAQQKLLNRKSLRENHRSLKLFSDHEDDDSLKFL